MVVFTCGACNESLKKNQVEKHYTQKCRRCEVLSCVDCGKDFWGDTYKEHVKCISEEEKYSGKNYVPRANANKGDKKQEMWTEQVETAIDKTRNPKLKGLLLKLKDHPNIPRKKAKFEKFLTNSLRIYDLKLISEVWDVLTSEMQQEKAEVVENGHSKNDKDEDAAITDSGAGDDGQKTLNKRERKEERRKKAMKKQKKDKPKSQSDESVEEETVTNDVKKKKKRKHQEIEEDEDSELVSTKKKKKQKHQEMEKDEELHSSKKIKQEESSENLNCSEISVGEETPTKQKKQKLKFRWQETMVSLLQKKGEMSLKRMKKKIIDEYISQGGFVMSENALSAKFDKKVKKIPLFKVHKDKVKLVE